MIVERSSIERLRWWAEGDGGSGADAVESSEEEASEVMTDITISKGWGICVFKKN
jgi:hypothetical protein